MCAPLKVPRKLHGMAAHNGLLYVFGGSGDPPMWYLDSVECYNPETNSWSARKSLPCSGSSTAATVGDFIYVFMYGKYVLRYNPATDTFQKLSNLPLADYHCFDSVSVAQSVFLVGGITNGRWSNACFRYDCESDTWAQGPPMSVPRRRCAAAVVDGVVESVGDQSEAKCVRVD
eukprot:c4421_g1_i2.p1 GENE.c4421_g1_i2~~c4421_g1_i2.p1  ORF type:complete len:174 (+),score=43.74 c4421_g1_i2:441-962(+)